MKKLTLFFIFALLIQSISFSQSCLPNGIIFTTQEQIDNFQTDNPGCTEIEGYVSIDNYYEDITNIDGLNVLTSIGGHFSISHLLTSNLSGLDNLTSIGGYFSISGGFTSLTGLDNLSFIGGYLRIKSADITDLTGLGNLITISGDFFLQDNFSLINLNGLDNLTTIGGSIDFGGYLDDNPILESISGLSNLTSIGGDISIAHCYALINLNGLENLTSIPGKLYLATNHSLTSLSGLENLTSTGGDVRISHVNAITNLAELNNLTSIGGELNILGNASLTSLSGLNNLTSVGESISIGGYNGSESVLTTLSDLINLTSIGGDFTILYNNDLTSLSGLDNIYPGSITSLTIKNNPSLYSCEVISVCDYLISSDAVVDIHDNANGCDNYEEVMAVCEFTNLSEISTKPIFIIYPNPANRKIYISNENGIVLNEVTIYNQFGQTALHKTEKIDEIDISMLSQGMYIIELVSNEINTKQKLIIR